MAALSSPLDTTNLADSCVVWLDAADVTTMALLSTGQNPTAADGEPVGYWRNKAPQSILNTYLGLSAFVNFTGGSTLNSRPTYRTTPNPTAIQFDGGDHLTCQTQPITYTQQTVFIVANPNNAGARVYTQAAAGVNDNNNAVGANSFIPCWISGTSSTLFTSLANGVLVATTNFRGPGFFDVFSSVHSGTVITNFANGVRTTAPASHNLNLAVTTSRIGAGLNFNLSTLGTFFTGFIAEIIVYNRALTDTERAEVEQYLGAKWKTPRHVYAVQSGDWNNPNTWLAGNLPLSGDHVYSNSYNVNVNQNVLVQSLRNHAFIPNIASGGTFILPEPVSVATLSGIGFYINNTTPLLSSSASSGTIALTGHIRGGNSPSCYGMQHIGNASISLSGLIAGGTNPNCFGLLAEGDIPSVTINGSILGGSSSGCFGVNCGGTGVQNFTTIGRVMAGTASDCYGINLSGSQTISNLNLLGGDFFGGSATRCWGIRTSQHAFNVQLSGNVIAGIGSECYGFYLSASNTCNMFLTGSVRGGSGTSSHGVLCTGTGDLNINGVVPNRLPVNFIGGSGTNNVGFYGDVAGNISLSGTAQGGSGTNAHGFVATDKTLNLYFLGLSGGSGIFACGANILSGSILGDVTVDGNIIGGTNTNAYGCWTEKINSFTVNNGFIRGSDSNVAGARGLYAPSFRYRTNYPGVPFHPTVTFKLNNVFIRGGAANSDCYGVVVETGQKAIITGTIVGSTAPGLHPLRDSDVTVIGTVIGGSTTNGAIYSSESNLRIYGTIIGGTGPTSGTGLKLDGGTVLVVGEVQGGLHPTYAAIGITKTVDNTSASTLTIRGNVIGGDNLGSYGVWHQSSGVLQVFGNVIANPTSGTNGIQSGEPATNQGWYILGSTSILDSSSVGTAYINAVRGYLTRTYICGNLIDAPNGGTAIWAFQYKYDPTPTNAVISYSTLGNNKLNMYTSDSLSAFSMPPVSAVRLGVPFANKSLVGTCNIPDPKSVKYRTPVDNTEGYAILEPSDFFNVSVAKLSAEGTLGNLLKRTLSTEAAGEIITSWDKPQTYIPPNQFSGLQLWLDASDSSTLYDDVVGGNQVSLNDSLVARWEDKSGNGRHATQSLNSARPLLKVAAKNNTNALKFDGIGDFFNVAGATSLFSNSHTIFAVAQTSVGGRDNATELFQAVIAAAGFHQTISFQGYPNSTIIRGEIWNSTDSESTISNLSYNQGDWCVATKRVNSTGFPSVQLFLNSVAGPVRQLTTFPLRTTANVRIGAANTVSPYAWFLNGHVCEIIIYNSLLSLNNIKSIESYLKNKWAIY